jgi:hypothetical protein
MVVVKAYIKDVVLVVLLVVPSVLLSRPEQGHRMGEVAVDVVAQLAGEREEM